MTPEQLKQYEEDKRITQDNLRKEILEQIQIMEKSARRLTQLWDMADNVTFNKLATDYPFNKSFDDISDLITTWEETQTKILKGIDIKA